MQITLDIPDQVAAKAAALGISVESYVRELVLRESEPGLKLHASPRTPEEIRAWLQEMAQFSDQIPELPDEALSRESIYQDHD
ncbi:MAG TPA: hypothetical protein VF018_00295 [Acidobacteriaceae bacterium]